MDCRNCQFENPAGARFCMSCGSPLANACPECGTELPSEARFCLSCGHQLAQSGSTGTAAAPDTSAETSRANLERYIPPELLNKLEAARTGGKTEGERRIVTMLFCDVSGSTAAAEKLDPEEWAQIMNGAFENLIAPVYRYEGTLARLMGDAILAFFGAPIGHEDDPQRAVRAGLEIVRDIAPYREKVKAQWGIDIEVRVGINTGLVVVGEVGSDLRVEYTALGDAINLAARMEQTAQPGTVQVSSDTHRLVEPIFEFEDLGLSEVKGKSEPVRTYRALGVKAVPGSLRGIEGLQAPLIGRDEEFAKLREVLAGLCEGRGGIISLIGEAGIGKSRLIEELHTEWVKIAGEEAPWIVSHGVSYDTTRPYGLFMQRMLQIFEIGDNDSREIVREKVAIAPVGFPPQVHKPVVRTLEALLAFGTESQGQQLKGEALQRELYDACHSMWREFASLAPTVLVLDDLHWADPASVEMMIDLFPLVDDVPLLIFCSFRPERQSPAWRLKQAAETDYPHRYTEIALSALSNEDAESLFENLLDIPDAPPQLRQMILAKTEGNPLFVEEFTRTLFDSGAVTREETGLQWNPEAKVEDIALPENLQALLTSRIDRLADGARRTLQLSSVIGRSFNHRVLERISDPTTVLDREISTLQRSELIEEESRLPELEYRFRHDLTRDAAYNSILIRARKEFHLRVGDTVEELFSDRLEEQAHLLAYHFYEAGADERALRYSLMAGESASRLHAHQEANSHYAKAIDLLDRVESDSQQRTATYIAQGRTLELTGDYEDALACYKKLGEMGTSQGDRAMELAAVVAQATVMALPMLTSDPDLCREISNKGLSLARELHDHHAESKVLWNLMLVEFYEGKDREAAVDYGEQSLAIAREHGLEEQLALTLNDLAKAYFTVDKGDQAWAAISESDDILRKLGNLPMLVDSLITSAGGHFFLGSLLEAMASAEECTEVSMSIGNVRVQAISLYVLGATYMELGEIGKAMAALEESIPILEKMGWHPPLTPQVRLALFCGMAGDIEGALSMANDALEGGNTRQFALAAKAQAYLSAGDYDRAQESMTEACKEFENGVSDPTAGYSVFQIIEGDVALANGSFGYALELADRTIGVLEEIGQRVALPDMLRFRGEALVGLGRLEEAQTALDQALAEAETQGSRRALCNILPALADLAGRRSDPDRAKELRLRAGEMVSFMADQAGSEEMRAMFMNSAKIKRLMDAL
ncbi:MAG: AAA family ATPase [Chloroflexi bacterium]|nr:AAA family ATPase [Chloroflexota bacterium]